jgi:transposase InsO family protein
MAFLDDASRMIMGYDLLPCKASCLTARVLGHTVIDGECAPYFVWSDNGGEFAGEFRDEMLHWGIVHKHTEPYNPEQNGKIERWWPTADKVSAEKLNGAVYVYNRRPHLALPPYQLTPTTGLFLSPLEQWENLPKSFPGQGGSWQVDGVVKRFV